MQRRMQESRLRQLSERTRLSTINLSKSNVSGSLMPLLLSTSVIHDGEKIVDISFIVKDKNTFTINMKIEREQ